MGKKGVIESFQSSFKIAASEILKKVVVISHEKIRQTSIINVKYDKELKSELRVGLPSRNTLSIALAETAVFMEHYEN